MATIKKFEDLISWKKARKLTRKIYQLTGKNSFSRDYRLKSQIEASAVSSMGNQAEGFGRGSKKSLINYFYTAKGSAAETQSHLYVALDKNYISQDEFDEAYGLADEVQRLIESFVKKVKENSKEGMQYK